MEQSRSQGRVEGEEFQKVKKVRFNYIVVLLIIRDCFFIECYGGCEISVAARIH